MPSMINLGYGQKIKVEMPTFFNYLASAEFTDNHKGLESLELMFELSI